MKILITGAAGFIGSHVAIGLLKRGDNILGIDNMNNYYDPALKEARLERIYKSDDSNNFEFLKTDISDKHAIQKIFADYQPDAVINLAAQAGVRYSLENPHAYVETNIVGFLNILEGCRNTRNLKHLVYASSSSVYGGNDKKPFSVTDNVDSPMSLYAATKKSDELMGYCYSHLYKFPATGLRFFTVYGPWGRPDMAYYLFADAMTNNKEINVFNNGEMKRDFTYIDDIVSGIIKALDTPAKPDNKNVAHKIYNLGNNKVETLMDYIGEIEKAMSVTAKKNMMGMQAGDVPETYADITETKNDLGYEPKTPITEGIPAFVKWYKKYYGV